jgi:hypothetical protein
VPSLSRKVLTLLQFTRFVLVFTAISNAQASILLSAGLRATEEKPWHAWLDWRLMVAMAVTSVGLYAFGMSLNDIVDRRRDAQLAADRPIPSGRIGVGFAHVVCAFLLCIASGGATWLTLHTAQPILTGSLFAATVLLIVFYDAAGKYLVPLGLIALGLIRLIHAILPDPSVPLPWHPLLLLNHVTILSAVAYAWEQKRPALSKKHAVLIGSGLLLINGAVLTLLLVRRAERLPEHWTNDLHVSNALIWPAIAAVIFFMVGGMIRRQQPDPRRAGKTLMLVGLLWLIVYDAAFVVGHVHWLPGIALLSLGLVAWLGVRVMRLWARVAELSEKPGYIRAR